MKIMEFTKKLVYLGDSPMTLKDGAGLHGLSFFDSEGQKTVLVNVMDSNAPVVSSLASISFGSPCNATFALRDTDKRNQYRLALVGLSPVQTK